MKQLVRLGDVCTVVSGSTPKTSVADYWGGDVKWITPAEFDADGFYIYDSVKHITELGRTKTGLSYMPVGTVLLSSRAPIGKTAIAGSEMCCNQGFKNLICSDKIYNEYLYHFLRAKTDYLNSLGRGATFKEISKAIVENVVIPLPSIDEQHEIANIFACVEENIKLRNRQLAKLDELVKSRFVELFGAPATNEKGWSIRDLESVTTVVTYGLTVRPEYISEGIDLVSARELHKGYVDYNSTPKIAENDFVKLSEKGKPQKNDILFSKTGSIGHCALVTEEKPFAITQNVARIGLKIDTVNPLWLLYYLRMDYIQGWCKDHAKGNAVKDFQLQDMKVIPLFDCPLALQNQFATFVEQVDKSKLLAQQSLEKLKMLKKALMQKYFE